MQITGTRTTTSTRRSIGLPNIIVLVLVLLLVLDGEIKKSGKIRRAFFLVLLLNFGIVPNNENEDDDEYDYDGRNFAWTRTRPRWRN
jgi:hypothetical protein